MIWIFRMLISTSGFFEISTFFYIIVISPVPVILIVRRQDKIAAQERVFAQLFERALVGGTRLDDTFVEAHHHDQGTGIVEGLRGLDVHYAVFDAIVRFAAEYPDTHIPLFSGRPDPGGIHQVVNLHTDVLGVGRPFVIEELPVEHVVLPIGAGLDEVVDHVDDVEDMVARVALAPAQLDAVALVDDAAAVPFLLERPVGIPVPAVVLELDVILEHAEIADAARSQVFDGNIPLGAAGDGHVPALVDDGIAVLMQPDFGLDVTDVRGGERQAGQAQRCQTGQKSFHRRSRLLQASRMMVSSSPAATAMTDASAPNTPPVNQLGPVMMGEKALSATGLPDTAKPRMFP